MVDVVSIVLAVVSLVGSLVAAGFAGWITWFIDSVKESRDVRKLTNKYRDPLTLSAYDLQSRFFGLVELKLLDYLHDEKKKVLVQEYTSYLIGSYFSWVYIFRRQAQFVRFSTDKTNKQLSRIMDAVAGEFSRDREGENAFMLWRGQQMAIGEVMTLSEDKEMYCMGFAAFSERYNNDSTFSKWFEAIDEGIEDLSRARNDGNDVAPNKLRRLQHLLMDLVLLLDKEIVASSGNKRTKTRGAPLCQCVDCKESVSMVQSKTRDGGEKA